MRKGRLFYDNSELVTILTTPDLQTGLSSTVATDVRMLIVPLPLAPQEIVAAVNQAGQQAISPRFNAVLEVPRDDLRERFNKIERADGSELIILRILNFGGEQQLECEKAGAP